MRACPTWASGSSNNSRSVWLAVLGACGDAGDHAGRFMRDGGEQIFDRFAGGLAPQLGKDLALDLAAEQRADAGAGEAEPELIDKIRRQHESIAERMADFGRIDVGARRRRAGPAFFVPIIENGSRGCDVSWTPPVPSRDGDGVRCPRPGHSRRLSPRRRTRSRCRAGKAAIGGRCALVLRSRWGRKPSPFSCHLCLRSAGQAA